MSFIVLSEYARAKSKPINELENLPQTEIVRYFLARKMDDTFFDGHDELYHHAKFGKDRTTRAGCRCENVVFVFLFLPAGCREAANCRYCF